MDYLFKIQEIIVPELISLAEIRYTILRNIYYNQPIGRRLLAEKVSMSERSVRNELEFLSFRGLINVSKSGAVMTTYGIDFLSSLDIYIGVIKNNNYLEESLKEIFNLKQVFVVPGELEYFDIKQEIGRFTATKLLKGFLKDNDILAVTGGSTLACIANSMRSNNKIKDLTVIPGRGGLGEEVEIQANTIASTIAKKLAGSYHLLQVPDNIMEETISRIISEPSIKKTLKILKKANVLLHGIGNAEEMAKRRGMSNNQIEDLMNKGAIGEAFGYYFDQKGRIVYSSSSIGLHLDDLKRIKKVIAVAGGVEKARAILAVVLGEYQDILIIDEMTAMEIINLKGEVK